MCEFELFKIDLRRLDEGGETFHYTLGNSFFNALENVEVRGGAVEATVEVRPVTHGCFELELHAEGNVTVPCNLCLDDMSQPVCADSKVIARFGDPEAIPSADSPYDDDVVIVDDEEGVIDVSWLIYEIIALDIPIKHVHEAGGCNPEMVKTLGEYMTTNEEEASGTHAVDPRWSDLEKLKTIIKD